MRRRRFQEYFIPNPNKNNDFSLNHENLRSLDYHLPMHPSVIPIKPPHSPSDNLIIRYTHHLRDASIGYLPTSSITPTLFKRSSFIALDLEGFDETNTNYSIAQLSTNDEIALLFDRLRGGDEIHQLLLSTLQRLPYLQYVFLHDCTCDIQALSRVFIEALTSENLSGQRKNFVDTQIIMEYFTHEVYTGFNRMIQYFLPSTQKQSHISKIDVGRKMKEDDHYWDTRDLTSEQIHYAAMDVLLLHQTIPFILQKVNEDEKWTEGLLNVFINATKKRMTYIFESKERYVMIHPTEHYMMSSELVEALADISTADSIYHQMITQQQKTSLMRVVGIDSVLSLYLDIFPLKHHDVIESTVKDLKSTSLTLSTDAQSSIDSNDVRIPLNEEEFSAIGEYLRRHSLPHFVDEQGKALTISFPTKTIIGQSFMMSDLLYHDSYAQNSILILSESPQSLSSTSLLRDFAARLSTTSSVIYVDSSNQLAEVDVAVIEQTVGRAVRVPVMNPNQQGDVIRANIASLRPSIVVIDDIRTMDDVRAVEFCKNQNIRVIAGCSAVRSFRQAIQLEPFNVMMGSPQPPAPASDRDRSQRRRATALLEVVIEVEESGTGYRILRDSAKTAEMILQYGKGKGELRKSSIVTKVEESSDVVIQRMAYFFIDL